MTGRRSMNVASAMTATRAETGSGIVIGTIDATEIDVIEIEALIEIMTDRDMNREEMTIDEKIMVEIEIGNGTVTIMMIMSVANEGIDEITGWKSGCI